MKARIVQVGNSKGIRIPKPLLEQTGLDGEVEIEADGGRLVISPLRRPRAGWTVALQTMATAGDDALIDTTPTTTFDEEDWEW